MGLKIKYQYTYFIHPYIIDKSKYDKYILKLFKDKRCEFRIFEKEKDMNIYTHFLPHFRNYVFPTFELRDAKLKEFRSLSKELQSKIVANQTCACFTYNLAENIKGKADLNQEGIFFNIEKIEIICFNTGICFFIIKTLIDGSNDFCDVLDFNYKFKDITSELSSLKDFENIRIQTDTFKDVKDISEFMGQITGIYKRKISGTKKELTSERFYTYSYTCLEAEHWNEKYSLDNNLSDFYRYVNVLPSNYSSDFNKESLEHNLSIIDKFKYYRIATTKLSSNLLCSGTDTYNYTKLPYEYENEYFYTYIITLYQKIFLRKLNSDFKEYATITKMRNEFINFTKLLWDKEITLSDNGTKYYKTLKNTLELDDLYDEIKNKYEIIYKELNIEKNNRYYTILIMLLIFSLTLNLVNILMLMYLIS
jgi:hypothetical protein